MIDYVKRPKSPTNYYSPTHEDGIKAAEAIAAEFGVEWHELRRFASAHLLEQHPDLEEIGSSDVSIHLAVMGNWHTQELRTEAAMIKERNELVDSIAARSGKTREETLASLIKLLAPID